MMIASDVKRPTIQHSSVHILIVDDIQTNLRLAKALFHLRVGEYFHAAK